MKRILLGLVLLICWASAALAATLLPNGEQQFFDNNGNPLNGGTVTMYVPSTTTFKNTWTDSGQTTLNTNPITLDSGGKAIIYGSGSYRQIVKDSLGNTIWDQLTTDTSTAASFAWGGTSGGTANAQTLSVASFTSTDGQTIYFIAGVTNTGATTLTISGGSPLSIRKDTPSGTTTLGGGEIVAGAVVGVVYDSVAGYFHLVTNNVQGFGALTDIAGASTTNLGTIVSHVARVTGSGATITAFGSGGSAITSNSLFFVTFAGDNQITYNATSLITPNGQSLHVSAGDFIALTYLGSGNWRILQYIPSFTAQKLVNAQTGTTYTVVTGDEGKLLTLSNASSVAVTVPQATGNFGAGFSFQVQNKGAGVVTLTPTTSTVNGAASLALPQDAGIELVSDGTNWQVAGTTPLSPVNRVLLNTLTASSSASLADTTSLTSTYNEYEIVFANVVPASATTHCMLRVNSGGVQSTTYVSVGLGFNAAGALVSSVTTYIPCTVANKTTTGAPGISGTFRVSNPSQTSSPKMFHGVFGYNSADASVGAGMVSTGYWNGGNGAVTGFEVSMGSGNIASGTIKVYGWR